MLISRAFGPGRTMKALGAYNFAGDIGKMAVPAAASLLLVVLPWRQAVSLLGGAALAAALAIFALAPRSVGDAAPRKGKAGSAEGPEATDRVAFATLLTVGMLDSAARMAFLTFLPFVLTAKGASLPAIGAALTAVFAGGAVGKLVCAFLGARIGAVATVWLTEIATALGIVALLPLPLEAALLLLPLVGVALNGTSSVLYGSVPELVAPASRVRAFSIFYTGTVGAGAVAPALYVMLGDAVGDAHALVVVAVMVLLNVPLVGLLSKRLSARRAAAGA
jgi:predicted MFS family arabinose efflux permease